MTDVRPLDLDSPRWAELDPEACSAEIPRILRGCANDPTEIDDDDWDFLFANDCYQGLYAAIPHLVRIAREYPDRIDPAYFSLFAVAELTRTLGRLPPDASLAGAYFAAMREVPSLASRMVTREWDEKEARVILGSLAAAKGHPELAYLILNDKRFEDPSEGPEATS